MSDWRPLRKNTCPGLSVHSCRIRIEENAPVAPGISLNGWWGQHLAEGDPVKKGWWRNIYLLRQCPNPRLSGWVSQRIFASKKRSCAHGGRLTLTITTGYMTKRWMMKMPLCSRFDLSMMDRCSSSIFWYQKHYLGCTEPGRTPHILASPLHSRGIFHLAVYGSWCGQGLWTNDE